MRTPNTVLKQYFGYTYFREGQETLINHILNRQDVLGIMPTGAGKSLCYQIPALLLDGITLVISPLISLMKDQVNTLTRLGIKAAFLNSTLTASQYNAALSNAKNGVYKIIYAAPERLLNDDFLFFAQQGNIAMVTVDEAHCISRWGQDFRPSYMMINEFIAQLTTRPVVSAFTATATRRVREDIKQSLALHNPMELVTGFDRKNLYFEVRQPKKKYEELSAYLKGKENEAGIIYCAARKTVEELCDKLHRDGFSVTRYHAGLLDAERAANQEDFIFDRYPLMVATNAFGMGIDKPDISFVVHYNMPGDMESYYQEAGRAGRDGRPADCILFFNGQDVRTQLFLIENSESESETDEETRQAVQANARQRLREMTTYCHTADCLRENILKYFGESPPESCENCSSCHAEGETVDITVDAQKILSCIARMKERYGVKMVIDTLRGSQNQKIRKLRLDKLSTYNIMKETPEKQVRELIHHLINKGYIFVTNDEFPIAKLTVAAQEILYGKARLEMKLSASAVSDLSKTEEIASKEIHTGLLDDLKKLRRSIAVEERVPAYVIFPDASLIDMCKRLPQDELAFLQVHGVGEVKLKKYGEVFLKVIMDFCKSGRFDDASDEGVNK